MQLEWREVVFARCGVNFESQLASPGEKESGTAKGDKEVLLEGGNKGVVGFSREAQMEYTPVAPLTSRSQLQCLRILNPLLQSVDPTFNSDGEWA